MSTNGNNIITGQPGLTRPRRLLLCLDGVPYAVIRAAKERGLFDIFHAPSRLLSPFPTMTNIALSAMLKATPPNGYESLYFDRKAKELRGGISKYIGRRTPDKVPSSYMDELDYQEPLPFEFLIYVAPEKVWRADMQRFRERFRAAPQTRDYFAFLKGTDGLLHIRGPKHLEVALESLDRILKEIHEVFGQETEIMLFSDHGMNLQENVKINLQTELRRHGFKFTSTLQNQNGHSVATPAFGLCGYAALYCKEEAIPKVADALVGLEGVDFSLHRDGHEAVVVKGARGTARIHKKETEGRTLYGYEQIAGDPLQLASTINELKQKNLLSADGFAPDAAWFERTADHIYPDALANLFRAMQTPRVGHTADVLVSTLDGYYYGSTLFSRMVRLAATHGNAMRASTNAFLMSTHRELAPFVRADDARPLLKG